MISPETIRELEALIGQLHSLHTEMSLLAKKSANDGVNKFKLKLINATLTRCNTLLSEQYRPFKDFQEFDHDEVPSNSDVALVIGQYQEALDQFRSEHVYMSYDSWYYKAPEGEPAVRTTPPLRVKGRQ